MRRDWAWFWLPALGGAGVTVGLVAGGVASDDAVVVLGGFGAAALVLEMARGRGKQAKPLAVPGKRRRA